MAPTTNAQRLLPAPQALRFALLTVYVLLVNLLFPIQQAVAQTSTCGSASVAIQRTPSTAGCLGDSITLAAIASGVSNLQWNICPVELTQTPTVVQLSSIQSATQFNRPSAMELVHEGGLWYGFVINRLTGNSITRISFGADVTNPNPTVATLSVSPSFSTPNDIALVKEGGVWYAFVMSVVGPNFVRRLRFGNGLGSPPDQDQNLTNLGGAGIALPNAMFAIESPAGKYLAFCNSSANSVTVVNMNGNWAGAPLSNATHSLGAGSGLYGITGAYDCNGIWSLFTLRGTVVSRLDFTAGLDNAPTISTLTTTGSGLASGTSLELVKDGGSWYLFTANSNGTFTRFVLGPNLTNQTPAGSTISGLGISTTYMIEAAQQNGKWHFFSAERDLSPTNPLRLDFPDPCASTANYTYATGASPTKLAFTAGGTYIISLSGTDANGFQLTDNDTVSVFSKPNVNFVASGTCVGEPIQFTENGGSTNIASYSWDMAGQATYTTANPQHTFAAINTYNVQLTVTDVNGCSNTITKAVTVGAKPNTTIIAPSVGCQRSPISFQDGTTGASITAWAWDFGDSQTSSAANPQHAYANPGTYTVRLIATSNAGCPDTATTTITINPAPQALFTVSQTCPGRATSFVSLATSPSGTVNHLWNFAGLGTSTSTSPNFTFPGPGTYPVKLRVQDPVSFCLDSTTVNVVVPASQPTPVITAPASVCQGSAANLLARSSLGNIIEYRWIIGFTDTIFGDSIRPTFNVGGTIPIQLRVRSATQCDSTINSTITVQQNGTLTFVDSSGRCLGDSTIFVATASTTPAIASYSWDFGGLGTSNAVSPKFVFPAAGTYNVRLTVTYANGCTNTVQRPIQIFNNPTAAFSWSFDFCNKRVIIKDLSNPAGSTITGRNWSFGGLAGNGSQGDQILNNVSPGTYPISYVVQTAAGCLSTAFRDTIRIPELFYSYAPTPSCLVDTIRLAGTATGLSNMSWDICPGDLALSPTATELTSLYGSNFNRPADMDIVQVNGNWFGFMVNRAVNANILRLDFGPDITNPNPTVTVLAMTPVLSAPNAIRLVREGSVWYAFIANTGGTNPFRRLRFGNGINNPPDQELALGTLNATVNNIGEIELVEENGNKFLLATSFIGSNLTVINLGNSWTNTVSVSAQNYNTFAGNNLYGLAAATDCNGVWSVFVSRVNVLTRFDFANGLNAAATNTLTLNTANMGWTAGASLELHQDGRVWYLTSANFNGSITRFTIGSDLQNASIKGATTSGLGLTNTYALKIVKQNGRYYGFSGQRDGVTPTGPVRYNFPEPCQTTANFTYSNQLNPQGLIFSTPGNYAVAINGVFNGQSYTDVDTIRVLPGPDVAFGFSKACANEPVFLLDSSTTTTGSISFWQWDITPLNYSYINNTSASSRAPVVQFNAPGTYIVKYVVQNSAGCVDSLSRTLVITSPPTSSFTYTTACFGKAMSFTSTSTPPATGGSIVAYRWEMGNGDLRFGPTFNYVYPRGGTYSVKLLVYSSTGCVDSSIQTISIPDLSITASNRCAGQPITLTANASYPNDVVTNYLWEFGNGGTGSGQTATVTYPNTGNYTIRLIVQTQNGCRDSTTLRITADNPPTAAFSTLGATCSGQLVQFANLSTAGGSPIIGYRWNFGDPASGAADSSALAEPVHAYATPGSYTVTMTVITLNGCAVQRQLTIDVGNAPTAAFTLPDTLCLGQAVQPQDLSTASTGRQIVEWAWFRDPTSFSTLQNPSFSYNAVGTYTLRLIVTDDIGCTDTLDRSFTIVSGATAGFTASTSSGEAPLTPVIISQAQNAASVRWVLNGVDIATGAAPALVLDTVGSYVLQQFVVGFGGCVDSTQLTFTVLPPTDKIIDIAINEITYQRNGAFTTLQALVQNKGTVPVYKFWFEAQANDPTVIREQWNAGDTLMPGEVRLFSLKTLIQEPLSPVPGFFCLEALLPNDSTDANPADNRLCRLKDEGSFYLRPPAPNPTLGITHITVITSASDELYVDLTDGAGRIVAILFDDIVPVGETRFDANLLDIAPGLYVLRGRFQNQELLYKLVKQ